MLLPRQRHWSPPARAAVENTNAYSPEGPCRPRRAPVPGRFLQTPEGACERTWLLRAERASANREPLVTVRLRFVVRVLVRTVRPLCGIAVVWNRSLACGEGRIAA